MTVLAQIHRAAVLWTLLVGCSVGAGLRLGLGPGPSRGVVLGTLAAVLALHLHVRQARAFLSATPNRFTAPAHIALRTLVLGAALAIAATLPTVSLPWTVPCLFLPQLVLVQLSRSAAGFPVAKT